MLQNGGASDPAVYFRDVRMSPVREAEGRQVGRSARAKSCMHLAKELRGVIATRGSRRKTEV